MKIEKKRLEDPIDPASLVVVIDVLRAFTTAAFAFAGGIKEIFVTRTIQEALDLHELHPHAFLLGEQHGKPIENFHFSNSPAEIVAATNLKDARLIQRTTCGTQGLLLSQNASVVLASSFVVAEATYQRIVQHNPSHVTFLITGHEEADEDAALADYLELKLKGQSPLIDPFLKRVKDSALAKKFLAIPNPRLTEDLHLALRADLFSFAMELSGKVLTHSQIF
jgi:2-phosphosulfolactate phosphatase